MANKVICSNTITFPKVEDMFPSTAECQINLQNGVVTFGEIVVPTIAGATVEFTSGPVGAYSDGSSVAVGDDVSGQTLSYALTGNTVTFTVKSSCEDIIITVDIPTEDTCFPEVLITDPCSCNTQTEINGIQYYLETFVLTLDEGCDPSTLMVDGFNVQNPLLDPNTQASLNPNDFGADSFVDIGNNQYELTVLSSGVSTVAFRAQCVTPTGNDDFTALWRSDCTFTCNCDFTALLNSADGVCVENNAFDLVYNISTNPNSRYRIQIFNSSGVELFQFEPSTPAGIQNIPGINTTSATDITVTAVVTLIDIVSGSTCPDTQTIVVPIHITTQADCNGCNDIGCNISCIEESRVECETPNCPPGTNGTINVSQVCKTVTYDILGNLCSESAPFQGPTVSITCTQCPSCERWDPAANGGIGGCVLDSGSQCSSTFGQCASGCNLSTCQCNTFTVCSDATACNVGASGPCIYCDCATCLNPGPSGTCGPDQYNCPNGGTVSDCGNCTGFPTLSGCTCTDSACAGFTGCDIYDNNPCVDCVCINGVANLTDVNGANCPCGTCQNGTCSGTQITDNQGTTCCTQDADQLAGCCNQNVFICNGIPQCGPCANTCQDVDPPITGVCNSDGSYTVIIGATSLNPSCNCTLNITGAITTSIPNYDGSAYTETIANPTAGALVNAFITCN